MIKTLLACALVASAPAAQAARYVCNTCNTNEQVTLKFMQERGINDKNALATVLETLNKSRCSTQIFVRVVHEYVMKTATKAVTV